MQVMGRMAGRLSSTILLGAAMLLAASAGRASAACVGDCNGDASVHIDELIIMVQVSLEQQDVSACAAGDADGDLIDRGDRDHRRGWRRLRHL